MTLIRFAIASANLLILSFLSSPAVAQVSTYGAVALSSYGIAPAGNPVRFGSDLASLVGGCFYNFPIHSRLTAGIDARGVYGPSAKGGAAATGALRIGFVPHRVAFRPYFEIGGGVVSAEGYPESPRYTNGAATFVVGLDIRLTSNLDLRAIDYGAIEGRSNYTAGSGAAFVDTGIVYHFHSSKKH